MNKVDKIILVIALLLMGAAIVLGREYPVPVIMNLLAIEEEIHYRQTEEYTEPWNLPDGKLSIQRLKDQGYEFWWSLGNYDENEAKSFVLQAWKFKACENGGELSYFVKQHDVLRFRCSTNYLLANETDKKVP